jgi:hypothetical protein
MPLESESSKASPRYAVALPQFISRVNHAVPCRSPPRPHTGAMTARAARTPSGRTKFLAREVALDRHDPGEDTKQPVDLRRPPDERAKQKLHTGTGIRDARRRLKSYIGSIAASGRRWFQQGGLVPPSPLLGPRQATPPAGSPLPIPGAEAGSITNPALPTSAQPGPYGTRTRNTPRRVPPPGPERAGGRN